MSTRKNLGPEHALAISFIAANCDIRREALRSVFRRNDDPEFVRRLLEVRDYLANNHIKDLAREITDAWWEVQAEEAKKAGLA